MAAPMALRRPGKKKLPHTRIVIQRNVETPNSVIQQAAADVNLEFREMTINGQKYEINVPDFQDQVVIGRGQYGVVSRVRHVPSNCIVAIKKIPLTVDKTEAKRAITDVKVSMSAQSPHCVRFYGYLVAEGDIWICMELMDISLDRLYPPIYAAGHRITEDIIGRIAFSVVSALHYLHKQLGVVHRDVKPSNILANCDGEIKICDYGISGKLQNSLAKTQDVGCKPYMAPERINPEQRSEAGYGVQSDVWSLGISVVEIAIGQHPYPKWQNVFEQLNKVVHGDSPSLPASEFSSEICDFVAQCLCKDYYQRPKYDKLLQHAFLVAWSGASGSVDMRSWVRWALRLAGGEVHDGGHVAATVGHISPSTSMLSSSSSSLLSRDNDPLVVVASSSVATSATSSPTAQAASRPMTTNNVDSTVGATAGLTAATGVSSPRSLATKTVANDNNSNNSLIPPGRSVNNSNSGSASLPPNSSSSPAHSHSFSSSSSSSSAAAAAAAAAAATPLIVISASSPPNAASATVSDDS